MNKPLLALTILLLVITIGLIVFLFYIKVLPPFQSTYDDSKNEEFKFGEYKIEPYATNLEIPWAVVHIDENTKLVTERPGRIRLIKNGILQPQPILTLNVVARGESGLMGMVKDPEFDENKFIYINHSYNDANGEMALKVVRYEFSDDKLINEKIILDNIPGGNIHASGEMAFGPDGKLYITTGDIGTKELAQDTKSIAGKTLRINSDGSIPKDNPFFTNIDSVKNLFFSTGHRNAQGIDWHPITQEMYQSEHGPSGFDGGVGQDEINLVRRGLNYGWPTIMGDAKKDVYESPLISFSPAIAPSSIIFYKGDMFPELKNKLLVAGLRGTAIFVFEVNGKEIKQLGTLVDNTYGRIRDLSIDKDGSLYFTTSNKDGRGTVRENDDKIYRVSR